VEVVLVVYSLVMVVVVAAVAELEMCQILEYSHQDQHIK
jgi:hypothetical protein